MSVSADVTAWETVRTQLQSGQEGRGREDGEHSRWVGWTEPLRGEGAGREELGRQQVVVRAQHPRTRPS